EPGRERRSVGSAGAGGRDCGQHDWALVCRRETQALALPPLAAYSRPPGFPGARSARAGHVGVRCGEEAPPPAPKGWANPPPGAAGQAAPDLAPLPTPGGAALV